MDELKYGLLGDHLVSIEDVESGLACNCLCPHCKAPLIARKGAQRAKHFAHYRLADCNHGTETALHLMAKNIVAETLKVFVPYVPKTEYDFSNQGKIITFEKAEMEKALSSSVRGDIILYSGSSYLNIEIKVTHEVDLEKTIELFNLGIPTIEVDLSDIKADFTPELIAERLLTATHIRLIHSPKTKEYFARRILGEWKTTCNNSNGTHVKDCPLSRKNAYFVDYCNKGGNYECHNCDAHIRYMRDHSVFDEAMFLCYGCLDGIDFGKIEKILHLKKEENHIHSVKLLMADGSVVEHGMNE